MMAPRWVGAAAAAGVLSLVLSVGIAWKVQQSDSAEERRDCERAVAARDDGRAMWLYVVETNTSADQARVDAFVTELNDRLPPLKCVDGNPVPDTDQLPVD